MEEVDIVLDIFRNIIDLCSMSYYFPSALGDLIKYSLRQSSAATKYIGRSVT